MREKNALRFAVAPITRVQVREADGTGDGSWTIEGYSAVYDQETTLWEVPGFIRVREEIARGAFANVLDRVRHGGELVHLNHGHDMKTVVAATNIQGIGGLELDDDFHGERFFARVDQQDPDARALAVKMRRGIVAQSSFAFTVGAEEVVEDRELDDGTWDIKFRITEVGHQYDVCACAQGAYSQTESHLRSLAAASLRVPDLSAFQRDRLPDELTQRIAKAREQRVDVAALELLVCAYDSVNDFIAIEDPEADADDIAKAQAVLGELDALIQVEAAEPNDNADALEDADGEMGRTSTGGVGPHGRRARGRSRVAPGTRAGEVDWERERELLAARAHAATETRKRRASR